MQSFILEGQSKDHFPDPGAAFLEHIPLISKKK
jgi:hypothetical protein